MTVNTGEPLHSWRRDLKEQKRGYTKGWSEYHGVGNDEEVFEKIEAKKHTYAKRQNETVEISRKEGSKNMTLTEHFKVKILPRVPVCVCKRERERDR